MTQPDIRHLTPREAYDLVARAGATLVDVREPAETKVLRAAGAVLLPLSEFRPEALPNGELIFICGSGKRSQMALDRCGAAGLDHRAHVAGGMAAWAAAGLPVVRG